MFTTLIIQPIFNLLVLIYSILPGHNFGVAIILFTIVVRLLMWPLVKKQLRQVKIQRQLQPEIKRIKAASKGDRREESRLLMELYKERGVNPFAPIGILILQIPILIGLYASLTRILNDPHQVVSFSYSFLHGLPWVEHLAQNIKAFDATLFGFMDLTRSALGPKGLYVPAMVIVIASAVVQFYQSKQLAPSSKDARSLRTILKDSSLGKQVDQSEITAATARSTRFLLPAMILLFTINIPSALALYWLVSGLVALVQQSVALREDVEDMEAKSGKGKKSSAKTSDREQKAVEAEIVSEPAKKASKPKPAARKKRRKK